MLDAAERHARVGGDDGVDEYRPGIDAARERGAAGDISSPDRRAETEGSAVGERDRRLGIRGADDRGGGTEGFLAYRRHPRHDLAQQRRRIEQYRPRCRPSPSQQARAATAASLTLEFARVTQVQAPAR